MLKELSNGDNPTRNTWARVCDTCRSSPCTVYCRADAAYLCSGCDSRVHAANQVASRHERVWVCEACERAPAAFLCKADAASLCADCDAEVHSANPLARRHHRVPILPLYGPSATNPGSRGEGAALPLAEAEEGFDDEDEDEAASWLLLNPSCNNKGNKNSNDNNNNNNNNNNGCFLGGEVDEYLDLVEYTSAGGDNGQISEENYTKPADHDRQYDSVVPIGIGEGKDAHDPHSFQIGVDYDLKSSYAYNNSSVSHSQVSVSSLDVGIVPESTTSDISTSHPQSSKGTIDLFSSPPLQQMPTQLSPMDREARVMRYREKKKTRKFEKTIRYASRKAYAETRPRIKGRFAKRSDVEVEVDQMFPNSIIADGGYGIVPSF